MVLISIGRRRVVAELTADPAEVHVDGLRRRPEACAPHVAHQLVATHDVARAGGQGMEQVVLLAGQHDLPLGAPHPAGRWVDANVLDLEHGQTVGRMAARRLKTGKLAAVARTGGDPGTGPSEVSVTPYGDRFR
jgi:hypothetical protein